MLISLTFAENGRGDSLESGKPTTPLFVKSVSSTLMVEGLGTWMALVYALAG